MSTNVFSCPLALIRQQMNPVGTPSKTDTETDSMGGSSNNLIRGKQSARFEEAWTRCWSGE